MSTFHITLKDGIYSIEGNGKKHLFSGKFFRVSLSGDFTIKEIHPSNIPASTQASAFRLALGTSHQAPASGLYHAQLGCFRPNPTDRGESGEFRGISIIGTADIADIGGGGEFPLQYYVDMENGEQIYIGMHAELPGVLQLFAAVNGTTYHLKMRKHLQERRNQNFGC